jgi:thioredoxin-related protein
LPSTIEKIHREFRPRGLSVLAVNLQEPRETITRWMAGRGVTTRVLLDEGEVAARYRVTVTPTVVLVDRRGRLVARAHGARPWADGAGRELLGALLARPGP